jgi:hypothetical protein
MNNKLSIAILLLVVALGGALVVWKYTFRKSDLNVALQKVDVEITAADLLQAFESDESKANELYLDKVLLVTGAVESVSEDSVGISVYLKIPDDLSGIICGFDKTASVESVEKGSVVRIKGMCTGYLMDVVMNRCSLEQAGSD